MVDFNFRKNFNKILPDKKGDFIKSEILDKAASQKGFYKEKKVIDKATKVSTKDNVLFVAGWKELTTKQKGIRFGVTFCCCLFLAFFSMSWHYSKDSKLLTFISAFIISAVSVFILTCIVSYISTREDRKITAEINDQVAEETKFSTTSIRTLISDIENLCYETLFQKYLPEKTEVQNPDSTLKETNETEPLEGTKKKTKQPTSFPKVS